MKEEKRERRFKIGDRVKIVSDSIGAFPETIGHVGTITKVYDDDESWDYLVKCDVGVEWNCRDIELEPADETQSYTASTSNSVISTVAAILAKSDLVYHDAIIDAAAWIEKNVSLDMAVRYLRNVAETW